MYTYIYDQNKYAHPYFFPMNATTAFNVQVWVHEKKARQPGQFQREAYCRIIEYISRYSDICEKPLRAISLKLFLRIIEIGDRERARHCPVRVRGDWIARRLKDQ